MSAYREPVLFTPVQTLAPLWPAAFTGTATATLPIKPPSPGMNHQDALGFDLRFKYAFAKAVTDSYQSSVSIFNQISNCRSCSKGPATFEVLHIKLLKARFGQRKEKWVGLVVGLDSERP